jgi:thioredoxin 1
MANIGAIDDETFQTTVLDSDIPVLLDFWAEWCTPCKLVSPVVEEIGNEQGNALKVATINVDENPAVTRQYGVLSIPSLILFKGGQEVARVVGAKPKEAILRDLGAHLSADA